MKRICIPLAEGFEEIEAITLIDVLRRAEFEVKTCCLQGVDVEGAHSVVVRADLSIDRALEGTWDLVGLPGGMPGSTNLKDDDRVGLLLKKTLEGGNYIAAICAAPIALGRFGLLKGKKATSYPGFEEQLAGADYQEKSVVIDGKIMTSRGPGTAMDFCLAIVAELSGKEKAQELKDQMLVKEPRNNNFTF